jgi:(S)-mandelate dehydrogenase
VAQISDGELWFQLYVLHRDIAFEMCDRAWASGYTTLILTVDVPLNGNRERDSRNGFGLPVKYTARTLLDGALHPAWSLDLLRHGTPKLRNFETLQTQNIEAQAALMRRQMDASFDFEALKDLRQKWRGKLIVKGLARVEDAQRCAAIGVDAVILSNHGGRQIESAVPALATLYETATAVDIPVFADGGAKRGSDIAKALCLGAGLVGLGRVLLYALAAQGEVGVTACLNILKAELDREQAMLGAPHIADLSRDLIHPSTTTYDVEPTTRTGSGHFARATKTHQQEEKYQ